MLTYKTTRLASCKAWVRKYENGALVLQSYSTDVILLTPGGWLVCSGTYSATTRQHISRFCREFTPAPFNYYDAKYAYENQCKINVSTGEHKKLPQELKIPFDVERLCALLDA